MFALTMLIRLGRITEQDVRSTFAAFQKLDKQNEGFISQKEVQGSNIFNPILEGVGDLLPRRNDNGSMNESSALLHPLSTSNKLNDQRNDYMSLSKLSEQRLPKNVRAISTDSLWSGISEEQWDDHP